MYAVNVAKSSKYGSLVRKKVMIRIVLNAGPQNQKLMSIAFVDTGNRPMEAGARNHNTFGQEAGRRIGDD